jgi:hypothetical protein
MADLNVLIHLMDINYHYPYGQVFLIYIYQSYPNADDMKLPQVKFTSPAEWNPDIYDDNRTPDEMIRKFPAVPHDAVNEFYDLKEMSTWITYAVRKPLILQPKLTVMTTASIQECLVYRHVIPKILVVMMTVTMTRNQPTHQQQCNGKSQLTTLMGRSLLVDVSVNNAQNVMQNVCIIVEKGLH